MPGPLSDPLPPRVPDGKKEHLAHLADERNALVGQATDWFAAGGRRIPASYLEKDFWVTEALRSLSRPLQLEAEGKPRGTLHARVIFKGGTSLSKAHGLIDRFSEDIDLYVVTRFQPAGEDPPVLPDFLDGEGVGNKRADRLFGSLAERMQADVQRDVVKDTGKDPRTGTRRAYRLEYATGGVPVALRPHVLIELTRMGNPEPNAPHQLRSLVNEYVIAAGIRDADFAEFEPVTMDVLMPHRTLIEKLCALEWCAQALGERPDALSHMARHFYDVHQLLGSDSVVESLAAEAGGADSIARDHVERSSAVRRETGPRPEGGFGHSRWIDVASVRSTARAAYGNQMNDLAYGAIPTFEEVCERVIARADLL